MREKHQGMKRTDNETRKRDVTDKARKQGHLPCTDIHTCEESVEPNPQAALKSRVRTMYLCAYSYPCLWCRWCRWCQLVPLVPAGAVGAEICVKTGEIEGISRDVDDVLQPEEPFDDENPQKQPETPPFLTRSGTPSQNRKLRLTRATPPTLLLYYTLLYLNSVEGAR